MGVLVVSFDAVSDKVFEAMACDAKRYPTVALFRREAHYQGAVPTVFLSNTYPVHTTVSTGRLPKDHGIISNLLPPKKNGERPWAQMAKNIRVKTIWEAAREKKLSTAAILWPVTCGADINWHIPEVHPEKGQNMLARSLCYGSVLFQLGTLLRHGGKLMQAVKGFAHGGGQPELDDFTTSASCAMLKAKKPDLALVHLIAYDTLFHYVGSAGKELELAKKALDTNLGRLIDSCSPDDTVIVFSDHSQLDVHKAINLNALYGSGAFFEQAGGSAFADKGAEGFAPDMEGQPWFGRYLTKAEMEESGFADKALFGIAAKPGYFFSESSAPCKGNHGYPADYEDYHVFYGVRGKNFAPGQEQKWLKKRLTDVTAIIARELNLDMDILDEYGVR
ncbi:MAG: alkaline phosphatase family protein [Treponema sp.]|nr:alkaline phosphatase family protein [Treponema sp.]